MCIDDFVGGDDSTGTTAELTDVEILAEVTTERTNEDAAEVVPASADSVSLPTSTEASAVLALPHRYCSAIEATGLSLVERLEYTLRKSCITRQDTLLQYFKPKE
ncbi:hypothetical protein HPB48_009188 [Haemaphysalis longicornis]|uniref:Uncharacterized protein n=1 Tax=Haemaphysalis longicornis TaxID=44386 RepID=A0A9J6G9X8_HAELO|nr:hypothetical protein HPB48_009188 [Haemaphysalis longicornis]